MLDFFCQASDNEEEALSLRAALVLRPATGIVPPAADNIAGPLVYGVDNWLPKVV